MKLIKKFESWTGKLNNKSRFTQEDMDVIWEAFQDVVTFFNIKAMKLAAVQDMQEFRDYTDYTNLYRIGLARNAWVEFILYKDSDEIIDMLRNNVVPVLRHEGFELLYGGSGDSKDGVIVNNDVDYDGNPCVEVLLTIKKS